jgi:hypothetical protein
MSSSRNTYQSNNAAAAAKPFCKVCRDAGRPESEYTSHFVKDQPGPQGKVICPTLLNQACRICGNTGHTSSYCSQYRPRHREEEPPRRREERYIEREPPRRDRDREERYIEREPRRREERDISFNLLREDTERREREIQERDHSYHREQDRLAKPWLQAALKPSSGSSSRSQQQQQRHQPYAHPHGPRVRLEIEASALCASKHAAAAAPEEKQEEGAPKFDILAAKLNPTEKWGDEDNEQPFVYNPEEMSREFFQQCVISTLTTSEEHELIAACDDQNQMPFFCGQ